MAEICLVVKCTLDTIEYDQPYLANQEEFGDQKTAKMKRRERRIMWD